MAKRPVAEELLDEDTMRLISLGDDPFAKAVRDAVCVRKPKEDDSDSCRST